MKRYAVIGVLQHADSDEWIEFVAEVEPDHPDNAIFDAAFLALDDAGKPRDTEDWGIWHMATVELAPGLPIVESGAETYMPDPGEAERRYPGRADDSLYVMAGDTMAGETLVQRVRAPYADPDAWAKAGKASAEPGAWYGGAVQKADGTFAAIAPGQQKVLTSTKPRAAAISKADRDVITRHRRMLGMGPIPQDAGYTNEELRAMAESIRTTGTLVNPAQAQTKLKRKLMR